MPVHIYHGENALEGAASGVSPRARSLITARGMTMGGSTKNPYQTDDNSLLFMADAEWNVGLFRHSSERRIVDIVSGVEATVPLSFVFGDKSITNDSSNTSVIVFETGLYSSGNIAVETCSCLLSRPTTYANLTGGHNYKGVNVGMFRRPSTDGCCGIMPCSFPKNGRIVYFGFPDITKARSDADNEVFGIERTRLLNASIPTDESKMSAYVNGEIMTGSNTMSYVDSYTPSTRVSFGGFGSSSGMRFRSMRVYGRHLTAQEAKRHYEIDKARFNLA